MSGRGVASRISRTESASSKHSADQISCDNNVPDTRSLLHNNQTAIVRLENEQKITPIASKGRSKSERIKSRRDTEPFRVESSDGDGEKICEYRRRSKPHDRHIKRYRHSEHGGSGNGSFDGHHDLGTRSPSLRHGRSSGDHTGSGSLLGGVSSSKQGKLEASTAVVLDGQVSRHQPLSKKKSSASGSSVKDLWRLRYQDFIPGGGSEKKGDTFQDLIDEANDWLKKNEDLQVRTCESLTRMSRDSRLTNDSEAMVLSKCIAHKMSTHNTRGLRLWLVPQQCGHSRPQRLCFADISPSTGEEGIQDLVNSANEKIECGELTGQILTIETIGVRLCSGSTVDSATTRWVDESNEDCAYAFVLRIFYNCEVNGRIYGSEKAKIGIKDFVPLPTDENYEGFEDLIARSNSWLKDQTDVLVTNMQSVMVQKHKDCHSETGSNCYYSIPGVNRQDPIDFFRILRVAYGRPVGDVLINLPVIYPFTYETFSPEVLRTKERRKGSCERVEKMNETFARVTAFLQNSGAEVISVETVANPMQINPQDNLNLISPSDEIKFLLTIRLYLTGKSSPDRLSSRSFRRGSGSSSRHRKRSSEEHPGPIFLRHVVTRRFKYRWLVLAVSVITCMTIVVIVSVVYSNI